jgi:hypothetical protein
MFFSNNMYLLKISFKITLNLLRLENGCLNLGAQLTFIIKLILNIN